MKIPTSAIGSIPRSPTVQSAMNSYQSNQLSKSDLDPILEEAVKETISSLEQTGSPIVNDGEQTKSSFVSYPLDGLKNLSMEGGVIIPFADGHERALPRLTSGPFRYANYAGSFLKLSKKYATKPLKQSVIAASALSLLYPKDGIEDYSREEFIEDLIQEAVADIRSCFEGGAAEIQIDFTEGRLAVKLDPSKELLKQFIDLNNKILDHFTEEERKCIGFHTCPGGDHDSTHSLDVPYQEFIPMFMTKLNCRNFYMQMASEEHPEQSLQLIAEHLLPHHLRVYIGVIDVLNEKVETAEEVRDRVLLAAKYIPVEHLGTTDDCGFSPFCDDGATSRDTAFGKIRARVEGTRMAEEELERRGGEEKE